VNLVAERPLPEPKEIEIVQVICKKQLIGKTFKANAKSVQDYLTGLPKEEIETMETIIANSGKHSCVLSNGLTVEILPDMFTVKRSKKKVQVEEFVPSVIEPSFGFGRLLYATLEHNFKIRAADEQRTFFSLPAVIAPYKCSLLPLSNKPDFQPFIDELSNSLTQLGVSHKVDTSSGSIGKRYARTDEIAIPYGITVDFDTVKIEPHTATLRERDTVVQIRVPISALPKLVCDLSNGIMSWDAAMNMYPIFAEQVNK